MYKNVNSIMYDWFETFEYVRNTFPVPRELNYC